MKTQITMRKDHEGHKDRRNEARATVDPYPARYDWGGVGQTRCFIFGTSLASFV
jgi:hypothetical protein